MRSTLSTTLAIHKARTLGRLLQEDRLSEEQLRGLPDCCRLVHCISPLASNPLNTSDGETFCARMKLKPGIIKVMSVAAFFCVTAILNLAQNRSKSCCEFCAVSAAGPSTNSPSKQNTLHRSRATLRCRKATSAPANANHSHDP